MTVWQASQEQTQSAKKQSQPEHVLKQEAILMVFLENRTEPVATLSTTPELTTA
jgi:hypothetical protein